MKRMIVTIGREYGSGGHEIGENLARKLGVAFYDKELLAVAAQKSGMNPALFEHNDEKPTNSLLYTLSVNPYAAGAIAGVDSVPLTQKIFLAQFDAIRGIARQEDCVIVGRCADYALRDEPDCVNLFIHAPLETRVRRIMERQKLGEAAAKDLIHKTDKKRAAYYNTYSDKKWGALDTYHMTIDSSVLGPEGTARLLEQFLKERA